MQLVEEQVAKIANNKSGKNTRHNTDCKHRHCTDNRGRESDCTERNEEQNTRYLVQIVDHFM